VENLEIGTATKNAVSIVCLKGYVADGLVDEVKTRVCLKGYVADGLVDEVKTRLRRIEVDGIIDSGQVTEFIQDSPNSLFSAVGITERPDILAAQLLEGKVGLVFDNTSFALFVPATLGIFMQTPDDYNNRYWVGSFTRRLRWMALFKRDTPCAREPPRPAGAAQRKDRARSRRTRSSWREIYPTVRVKVKADFLVEHTGLMSQPLEFR